MAAVPAARDPRGAVAASMPTAAQAATIIGKTASAPHTSSPLSSESPATLITNASSPATSTASSPSGLRRRAQIHAAANAMLISTAMAILAL